MTSSADTRGSRARATSSAAASVRGERTAPRPSARRVAGSRRRTGSPGRDITTRTADGRGLRSWRARVAGERAAAAAAPPARTAAEATAPRPSARRHTGWWPALAAGLALVLLAVALVVSTRPILGDRDREAAVSSARTSLESLLSYSGASFDAHVAEVTPRLTSPFREEFTTVAARDIKPMAVKNGATVLAKVYEAGVMDATGSGEDGSTVRVLAFVNQATTTTAQKAPAIDQNRVIATMRKVGGRWLISRLEAF